MLKEQCVEMTFDNDGEWQEIKEQYEKLGYKIVDWSINYMKKEFYLKAILTDDNKFRDTKKEENKIKYNIHEVMEFPEETEFINKCKRTVKVRNGVLQVLNRKNEWLTCNLNKIWLDDKFKLVKKDKKVEVMEAMKAYGKEIYCIYNNGEEDMKVSYKLNHKYNQFDGDVQYSICPEQILNGKWYIKEE
ncbi:hypothetical protein [Clostridium sp. CTA-6]|nr:hypothetical protein [Clostridium botulinum]EKS4395715.1 hypothetical protein [Clostridium botulinum]